MLNYYYGYLGTIPSTIGQLTKLAYLLIEYNKLTGTIPTSIGLLSSIVAMQLHDNLLTGMVIVIFLMFYFLRFSSRIYTKSCFYD